MISLSYFDITGFVITLEDNKDIGMGTPATRKKTQTIFRFEDGLIREDLE